MQSSTLTMLSRGAPIRVALFDDRLEIENPRLLRSDSPSTTFRKASQSFEIGSLAAYFKNSD